MERQQPENRHQYELNILRLDDQGVNPEGLDKALSHASSNIFNSRTSEQAAQHADSRGLKDVYRRKSARQFEAAKLIVEVLDLVRPRPDGESWRGEVEARVDERLPVYSRLRKEANLDARRRAEDPHFMKSLQSLPGPATAPEATDEWIDNLPENREP